MTTEAPQPCASTTLATSIVENLVWNLAALTIARPKLMMSPTMELMDLTLILLPTDFSSSSSLASAFTSFLSGT